MKTIRKIKRVIFIFWVVLTIFYLVRLVIVSKYVGLNGTLADLQNQAVKLTLDNQILEVEIAKESSLTTISKKASESGFIKTEKIMYIK